MYIYIFKLCIIQCYYSPSKSAPFFHLCLFPALFCRFLKVTFLLDCPQEWGPRLRIFMYWVLLIGWVGVGICSRVERQPAVWADAMRWCILSALTLSDTVAHGRCPMVLGAAAAGIVVMWWWKGSSFSLLIGGKVARVELLCVPVFVVQGSAVWQLLHAPWRRQPWHPVVTRWIDGGLNGCEGGRLVCWQVGWSSITARVSCSISSVRFGWGATSDTLCVCKRIGKLLKCIGCKCNEISFQSIPDLFYCTILFKKYFSTIRNWNAFVSGTTFRSPELGNVFNV